jgi:3-(3-hydroxy-phenyl)propionate hydroxylase
VVVDVADRPDGGLPVERVFHYEHPAMDGRTVLRVPFAGGFQIDLQCRDDDPPSAYGTEEAVQRWLPEVVGPGWADRVLWVSTYRFLQVVADAFRDTSGRVLLVGEAAHLFPPFGARGMNSGIADAETAAEAIAAALAEPDGAAAAVNAFAGRRRAAALFNSRAAGTALAHLRPGRLMRAKQHAAAALAPVLPRCGSWLEHAPYGPRHVAPGRY